MKKLGPATEEDMVRAFVGAEIESPTYRVGYAAIFARYGMTLDQARTGLKEGNPRAMQLARAALRAGRGDQRDEYLFARTTKVQNWTVVELDDEDFVALLRYASYPSWVELSNGTRCAIDGAATVRENPQKSASTAAISASVKAIAADIEHGKVFPPLIGIQSPGGPIVLYEGHTRATAFAFAGKRSGVQVIVGAVANLTTWKWA